MECHPVPATGLLHDRRQGIAQLRKGQLQGLQADQLLGSGGERDVHSHVHIREYIIFLYESYLLYEFFG